MSNNVDIFSFYQAGGQAYKENESICLQDTAL